MHPALSRSAAVAAGFALTLFPGCSRDSLEDNAGGRQPEDLPEIAADVFQPLDGGVTLGPDEIKGRNTWNLWTGGNEQFWDRMARESFGLMDLLRTTDSRRRPRRFAELGLINQPGMRMASQPDEYGLWIDEVVEPEPAAIDPAVYGRPTGIMGFRLFPNPDFDAKARQAWDADRYYNDPDYAVRPDLIRPYTVGVSCGSCHIAFHPLNPPADPENPAWDNLASAIGNQYIREGAVFAPNVKPGGFFWEMLLAQPPGTSDTSRIATDNINNPNSINPIFELGARLQVAHRENVSGDTLHLPTVESPMLTPMVLKDGADSVGVPGATLRVFINIGMYSQHWLQQHNALVGLQPQKPFSIATAQEHSVFWRATEHKFENIAKFFTQLKPWRLADAPDGKAHLTDDPAVLRRGKLAFATECATCHSSKRPPAGADEDAWFEEAVLRDDFAEGNFFADERRHPITKIKTNAGRALATNAMKGHVWDAFSSDDYKALKSPGTLVVYNPYTDAEERFPIPDGGPGYYRTPSLIALWTSAPFFHNNALGIYTGDPSVAGRMRAFNDAAEKLLWPEKRLGRDSIWRTTQECNLQIQAAALPRALRVILKPHLDPDGYFRIGPIPAGTPVNLLANFDPDTPAPEMARLILRIKRTLAEIKIRQLDEAATHDLMRREIAPLLFAASKSPDFITDRGHTFGSDLPDDDKRALIEYLKTL